MGTERNFHEKKKKYHENDRDYNRRNQKASNKPRIDYKKKIKRELLEKTVNEMVDKIDKEYKIIASFPLNSLIDYSKKLAEDTSLIEVKKHQLRRFFESIKKIRIEVEKNKTGVIDNANLAKLYMLRPQLVNAGKKRPELKQLEKVCSEMIRRIKSVEDFYNFANFFESLVAFHNAYAKD